METETWASPACTLPTAERPTREAEFDDFFARSVRDVQRRSATDLRLTLEPSADVAAAAAELTVRETACCSFFTFAVTATGGQLWLDVTVSEPHVGVLDGFARAARAAA
jgi:hypothetical protein